MTVNGWIAVKEENDNIRHVRTVSIYGVKDLRSRESERTGHVCPSPGKSNVSYCVLQRRYVHELVEVKVQCCIGTLMQ